MTDIELARRDHEQAKRHLRRVEQERARCRYGYLDIELGKARGRLERTLAELRRLEATQPTGELESPAPN